MKFSLYFQTALLLSIFPCLAQSQSISPDSLSDPLKSQIREVTIRAARTERALRPLEDVHATYLLAGKKTACINVSETNANLAEKNARQVFAKMPGVFVYDMDGSGNQVNIATRGLDPHRSWEYNVRQNGVMLNSDIYGYPASHYSPPMESIQSIEMIHGTGSLQYGAAFGGMINYITKTADSTRRIGGEILLTTGSFGLGSAYASLGGRSGEWTYFGYAHRRVSDGYREQAKSDASAEFASLTYHFRPKSSLTAELGHSTYLYQIPGPLTDSMFLADPRQRTRQRNYYSPDIYVPSLRFDWQINANTRVQWINSAVLGSRNSVQFLAFADVPDAIDPLTGKYKPRQVDIDGFNSYTSELRISHDYRIGRFKNTMVAGTRLINNDLHRRQLGKGSSNSDFDLSLSDPTWGRDLHFRTKNAAFFLENLFRINADLSISPGFRLEKGITKMSGTIVSVPEANISKEIAHKFPLFGVSAQWMPGSHFRLYGGWSEAYRPVLFSDIIPASPLERSDPDLQDACGHNLELGINGRADIGLTYDLTIFELRYKNRIGSLVETDPNGSAYIYKTNVGDSRTRGIEGYIEWKPFIQRETRWMGLSVFTATSVFSATYLRGNVVLNGENINVRGNEVETTPKFISRNGLTLRFWRCLLSTQMSYVSQSYSDALNTETPSPNGAKGVVPDYMVWDMGASVRFGGHYLLRGNITNLGNAQYFTKRPTGYPGQGVWSSDGRAFQITLNIKL